MSGLSRPKLSLKLAYERVKSAITGIKKDIAELEPIAKHSAGNGIYNGKMTISQRGDFTSATAIEHATYYLDRWWVDLIGVTGTIQSLTDAVKLVATSTSSGRLGVRQLVEDYLKYSGITNTFSAKVTSNNPNARIFIYTGSGFVSSATHSGNGTEELLSITADTVISAANEFTIGIASSVGTGVTITSGDYIEFTDVRLDLGDHRLSGDREYAEELALCQRYYEKITVAANEGICPLYGQSASNARGVYSYKVRKRVSPTVTFDVVGNYWVQGNGGNATITSIVVGGVNEYTIRVDIAVSVVQGYAYTLIGQTGVAGIYISAEL